MLLQLLELRFVKVLGIYLSTFSFPQINQNMWIVESLVCFESEARRTSSAIETEVKYRSFKAVPEELVVLQVLEMLIRITENFFVQKLKGSF